MGPTGYSRRNEMGDTEIAIMSYGLTFIFIILFVLYIIFRRK